MQTIQHTRPLTPENLAAAIKKAGAEARKSPASARALFLRLGIFDAKGQLAPQFGGPCKN